MRQLFESKNGLPKRWRSPTAKLGFDVLEDRCCPAAPAIANFSVMVLEQNSILATGTVIDESPGNAQISFSGAANGSTVPNVDGNFSWVGMNASLGTLTAVATDNEQLTSSPVHDEVTTNAPTITLSYKHLPGKQVLLTGTVSDESPAGLTVTFSGLVNETAVTDTTGTFNLVVSLSELGKINASVTDWWGVSSNIATVDVTNEAPQIVDFTITKEWTNYYKFRGRVIDEVPNGLVVQLSGLPTLDAGSGTYVTVGSDGWFEISIQLGPDEIGEVTATVTDWWGEIATAMDEIE